MLTQIKNRIASLHHAPKGKMSPWLWPLLLLEFFYRLGVSFRLLAYRQGWLKSHRVPVPVISIGNLTTGGTGKTPMVIEIARGLISAGKRVVVLSRGYGAPEPLAYGRATDPRHGDEAFLIQQEVPEAVVIVGRDRIHTIERAIADYHPDVVILDDGFQYLRLHRNINILLIDGQRLLGNGHLLPAGPLREPLQELSRADLVFVTKQVSPDAMQTVEAWVQQYGKMTRPAGQRPPIIPVPFQPVGLRFLQSETESFDSFRGRAVVAFSGIARPEQFKQDLKSAGLHVVHHFRFSDHQVYTSVEVNEIITALKRHESRQPEQQPAPQSTPQPNQQPLLVTTEKDLVKIRHLIPTEWQARTCTLQVAPALDGRWFHDEFLTQMPGYARAGEGHAQSSSPRR